MIRNLRTTMLMLALVALATSVVSPARAAVSGAPIVIGAILSISGNYAPLGEPERDALKVAEADINAHGGVAGHLLHIDIVDDEGKPDTAQQLATQFVGQHVAAIIGGTLTPTSAAIARVTNDAKIVQVYMTPTDTLWDSRAGVMKYLFEATPRNRLEADKLLSYMKTKLHAKRVAIMHDDAPYGTAGAGIVHDRAQKIGVEIVDDEAFAISATDLTPQLQKAMAAQADALLIWTAAPSAPILVRQAKQFGFKGAIVGSTGIVSKNFLKVAGRDGYGVYADMDLNITHPDGVQAAFLQSYRDAYHASPANFASFAWDAAHLLARALDATKGNTNGDAVSDALLGMAPYHGTTGLFHFTATDHNGLGPLAVKVCQDQGAWIVIE